MRLIYLFAAFTCVAARHKKHHHHHHHHHSHHHNSSPKFSDPPQEVVPEPPSSNTEISTPPPQNKMAPAPISDSPIMTHVAFEWGETKVRGVSLGGWLVLEGFLKPSIYEDAGPGVRDEWSLCEALGKDEALKRLQHHWDTWVTLQDFQRIQAAGLNVVRIPVGYWAYADFGEPFVQGAAPYVDLAIGWARQTGLKIILDLHGAPKSQNGWEHSGRAGALEWGGRDSVDKTLQVLTTMSKYVKSEYQDVVIAIQVLNEPYVARLDTKTVFDFYQSAYDLFRGVSDTPILFADGFYNPGFWSGVLPSAPGAIMDHHEYQIFAASLIKFSLEQHTARVCSSTSEWSGGDKLQLVGEFSTAMTDCAPWLNGRGSSSLYDNSLPGGTHNENWNCAAINNITLWTQSMKDGHRKYLEAQLDSFEDGSQGWIFWNFKTEGVAEWDLYALLDAGVFPQPLTSRAFPKNDCSR